VDWYSFRTEPVIGVEEEGAVIKSSMDLTNVGIAISKAQKTAKDVPVRRAIIDILSNAAQTFDFDILYTFAQRTRAKLVKGSYTTLFTLDREVHDNQTLSSFHQMFDGLIDILRTREETRTVNKIGVLSMTYTSFDSGYKPLEFKDGRISVVIEKVKVAGVRGEDEREAFVRKLEEWADAGYHVAPLQALISKDIDTVREAFATYEKAAKALEDLREDFELLDTEGFEAEAGAIVNMLGDPMEINDIRTLFKRLKERIKERRDEAILKEMEEVSLRLQKPGVSKPISDIGGLVDGKGLINGQGLVNGRGLVNGTGLVNGQGLVNGRGLVNGQGLVNGKGLVNGQGLVNGRGLINGRGLVNGRSLVNGAALRGGIRVARRRRGMWVKMGIIAIVVLVLLAVPLLAIRQFEEEGLSIDGEFKDWDKKLMYVDGPDPSVPNDIDITRYSVAMQDKRLFFYVQVEGQILSGRGSPDGVDVINIFLDSDGMASTGYSIRGMGADAKMTIFGFDGKVKGASISTFDDSRGRSDWNGWVSSERATVQISGSKAEVSVSKGSVRWLDGVRPLVMFQVMDARSGRADYSEAMVSPGEAALVVGQECTAQEVLAAGDDDVGVLELTFEAKGRAVNVQHIRVTRSGDASDGSTGTVTLRMGSEVLDSGNFTGGSGEMDLAIAERFEPGRIVVLQVLVDIPVDITGVSFGLGIEGPEDVTIEKGVVTTAPSPLKRSYIGAPPVEIVIDGAFGDWDTITLVEDPRGDASDPNIDITDYGTFKGDGSIAFFVAVDGSMLGGASTPSAKIVRPSPGPGPGPGPGPVPPLPELVGADQVRVLIDSDNVPLTGSPIQGLAFGADYALVITGKEGTIQGQDLYVWSGADKDWSSTSRTFEAANDDTRMEVQLPLSVLGLADNASFGVYFHASDWSDEEDFSDEKVQIIDPLQLTADADVYSSSDGNTWTDEGDFSAKTFVDITIDSSGYAVALAEDGQVFESTGDWGSWSSIISASGGSAFIAIATDSGATQYYYALETDGDVYMTSGASWGDAVGDSGGNTDYEDMCYRSGLGANANLYVIRSATAARVRESTDGGGKWGDFGNKDVGGVGTTNKGIVYGNGNYYIVQANGDVRYDSDGKTSSPWPVIDSPAAGTYADIDYDSGGSLWTVTTSGQTYKYTISTTTWSTLGTSSESSVVAIGVNEIPEFQDLIIPVVGTIIIFLIIRRKKKVKKPDD
jgi:hypothetical protein